MNLSGARAKAVLAILFLTAGLPVCAQSVTTSQYDNARSGANQLETALTPRNVTVSHFGKNLALKVDGDVYAQPLFLAGLDIPGKGLHDVLFVATEHDSLYAFDAYGHPASPLWHVSFLRKGVTTVPADDVECPYIEPEVGITSTPVIDADTGTLYVLARTKEQTPQSTRYTQRLHALAVTTGLEEYGGPVDIRATINGKGTGSLSGKLAFDPLRENPRASLLLANGLVYLTWASSCDVGPYHGWVMAYDAHSLKRQAVFNTSPDGDDSGIWASDTGPAADERGNLFLATGNGRFDAANGGRDYGDSLLKLDGQTLKLDDYFAPFNVEKLNANDNDLGSGGPTLLPAQPGPHHPHLAVIAGKEGTIYLIDRDHLGHHQPNNDSQIIQTVPSPGGSVFGSIAFWNHNLYVLSNSSNDALRQFVLHNGKLTLKAASGSRFPAISATPTVSSNGARDGVLWMLRSQAGNVDYNNAVLYAFDASDSSRLLYNSEQNPSRDRVGQAVRFNIPMIANGHVYVGAKHEVDVYGLLSGKKPSK
jgi:hypothetical protein